MSAVIVTFVGVDLSSIATEALGCTAHLKGGRSREPTLPQKGSGLIKLAYTELLHCPLAIGPVKQTCCLLKEQWLLDSAVLTAINPRDIFAQPPSVANVMAEQVHWYAQL